MLAWNARPPAPETVGDAHTWQTQWRDRLAHHQPWLYDWLAHQARDAFWQHGSICETYAAVKCPVLVIGGWADGYHNGVQRMLTMLTGCSVRKGVIGPWSHDWPNVATPGPPIGFLALCRDWWDFALNGVTNGADAGPDLQLFVKAALPDAMLTPQIATYPGKWLGVQDAHALQQRFVTLRCAPLGVLRRDTDELVAINSGSSTNVDSECTVRTQSLQGAWSGEWLSFGGPDMPGDQANDDALANTWTTAPLDNSDVIEIVGYPEVQLALMSSHAQALIVARLCDVAPSGKSTLISRGVLNLSHRDGHAPEMLETMPVDTVVDVAWQLNYCAYTVAAGHRVRLALTPHYWPLIWPSPEPVTLTIKLNRKSNVVRLPVLDVDATVSPCPVKAYPLDVGTPSRAILLREPAPLERTLTLKLSEVDATNPQQQVLTVAEDDGTCLLLDEGITMDERCEKRYAIDLNCLHPRVDITRTLLYEKLDASAHQTMLREHAAAVAAATTTATTTDSVDLGNKDSDVNDDESLPSVTRVDFAEHAAIPWKASVTTTSAMWSDATSFYLQDHLAVYLDDELLFDKSWTKEIARRFV